MVHLGGVPGLLGLAQIGRPSHPTSCKTIANGELTALRFPGERILHDFDIAPKQGSRWGPKTWMR